jgi:protein phosphatase PTC7
MLINTLRSQTPLTVKIQLTTRRGLARIQVNARTVADILRIKQPRIFTISQSSTIGDAIDHLVTQQLASLLAVTEAGDINGLLTARDILRIIHKNKYIDFKQIKVHDVMTNKEKMIYCSSTDTVSKVLETMYQVKIRNIPVIDKNEVSGIITLKDLADAAFSVMHTGGKKGFISNVLGRIGIAPGTRLNTEIARTALDKQGARYMPDLGIEIASHAEPHPFKRSRTVAPNRRDYGSDDLCDDMSLCEDAHFALRCQSDHVYLCVADGVGSWRDYGVDPRLFSHTLVANAKHLITSHRYAVAEPFHPLDVLAEAWNVTVGSKVLGSSTFCFATLDRVKNQLTYSNIGDCGVMVVRHIDSEKAGYMRNRTQPRHLRETDMQIAYLSQQQLRSFNLPYQLGYAVGIPNHSGIFETPADADTASIPVMPGDIILMATDGLFDNLDLDEIVDEISVWEKKYFPGSMRLIPDSSMDDIRIPCEKGSHAMEQLARQIVSKARMLSLDTKRDSPFALLAKENDIMWGGGMPDDTSVVVARVFDKGLSSS